MYRPSPYLSSCLRPFGPSCRRRGSVGFVARLANQGAGVQHRTCFRRAVARPNFVPSVSENESFPIMTRTEVGYLFVHLNRRAELIPHDIGQLVYELTYRY